MQHILTNVWGIIMSFEEIKKEIKRLNQSERLLLVEDTWNLIATDNNDVPMYDWQKRELDKRYEEYKSGKLELHDWKLVHNKLREQYK